MTWKEMIHQYHIKVFERLRDVFSFLKGEIFTSFLLNVDLFCMNRFIEDRKNVDILPIRMIRKKKIYN